MIFTAGLLGQNIITDSGGMGHKSIFMWIKVRYNRNTFTVLEFLKFHNTSTVSFKLIFS